MLTNLKILIITALIVTLSSCASIVSRSWYPVSFESEPSQAQITVTDRNGKQLFSGKTPKVLELKSSAGFFKRASYIVIFNKPGFAERKIALTATVNGWYFGNLLFGGILGFLVIDPATGAMYRLKTQDVRETLDPDPASSTAAHATTLRVYDINDIPAALRSKMERVQ
jgi:hypothetical protein